MTANRPNILRIANDQQHWFTLGRDNPRIQTPNLDRLAASGTQFDRAYCPSPVCSPSRSSIITGQYPSSHGCWTIGVKLAEDVPTVGDALQEHGYQTTLIGKAHFQPLQSTPEQTCWRRSKRSATAHARGFAFSAPAAPNAHLARRITSRVAPRLS